MIIKSLWERVFKGNEPSSSFRKAIVTNKYEKQGRVFLGTLRLEGRKNRMIEKNR